MKIWRVLFASLAGVLWCSSIWPAKADDLLRIRVKGTDRTYFLHGFRKDAPLRPLVIVLHGWSSDAENMVRTFGMNDVADREDFLVAYPDGFARTWNYGVPVDKTSKPLARGQPVDDLLFLKTLIERLKQRVGVDPARIYLTGFSYGGMMTFAAACHLAPELAGVAPLFTGMSAQQRDDCGPEKPIPLLLIAGTKDTAQSYGGEFNGETPLLSVPDTVEFWKKRNGCSTASEETLPHLNGSDDPTAIIVARYTGCSESGDLVFYRVEGGTHQVPSKSAPIREGRNRDIESAEAIWAFFQKHRR